MIGMVSHRVESLACRQSGALSLVELPRDCTLIGWNHDVADVSYEGHFLPFAVPLWYKGTQ